MKLKVYQDFHVEIMKRVCNSLFCVDIYNADFKLCGAIFNVNFSDSLLHVQICASYVWGAIFLISFGGF